MNNKDGIVSRELLEAYAVMAYVLSDIKTNLDKTLMQVEFNQTTLDKKRFQIAECVQSALNAVDEALTDLNDERKAYIQEVQ